MRTRPLRPSPPRRRRRARQRRKEARPQELLDAALDLFVERGFAATRSEDVAARAGVSKGTLYLYYPSKEELLKAVIRHNVVEPDRRGRATSSRQFEGGTRRAAARCCCALWWERIGETRASGIIKLMISEVRNFPEIAQFYVDEVITPVEPAARQRDRSAASSAASSAGAERAAGRARAGRADGVAAR